MTWAWIETSRADTGSSQMISFGPQGQGAGDPDALPLAAGELGREPVVVLGVEADDAPSAPGPASCSSSPSAMPWISNGSPMIAPTRLRGFSDEYGSWKIIWISRRSWRICLPLQVGDVLAVELDRALGDAAAAGRSAGPGWTCRSRSRRPARGSRPGTTSRSTPSTACTRPTSRWKMMPWVIGKYFLTPVTLTSGSLSAVVRCSVSTLMPAPRCARCGSLSSSGQVAGRQVRRLAPGRPAPARARPLVQTSMT